jgi:hypothetical protein
MRLHSTAESVKAREVTVLAIVETVVAVGLTILTAFKRDTLLYFAISVLLAPFLLLRNEYSYNTMVLWLKKIDNITYNIDNFIDKAVDEINKRTKGVVFYLNGIFIVIFSTCPLLYFLCLLLL